MTPTTASKTDHTPTDMRAFTHDEGDHNPPHRSVPAEPSTPIVHDIRTAARTETPEVGLATTPQASTA